MTRDDIIRMAREAGFQCLLPEEHIDGTGCIYSGDDEITPQLERFAALVAAAERKRIESTPWGAGKEWIARAVEAEREACAKVADDLQDKASPFTDYVADVGAAIRRRGEL